MNVANGELGGLTLLFDDLADTMEESSVARPQRTLVVDQLHLSGDWGRMLPIDMVHG